MNDIIFSRSPRFPENKYRPKVLFCSHPDDAKLRDEIEKDITSAFECDIWYHDEPTEEYNEENYLHDLYSMHLIVVPVTTKLLTKPSFAMEKILPYALQGKKHIAVLPLMQENGLEDVYAKSIFDDLQFLNKFDPDPTALPYKEKLKKYLEGVLTDGETVKKIQDAFDAYIFMSYRKKDRAFAQRLMETIHKNPKLRDVAIWYDEYLVPGESFNKTIASALDKSELFALVVTPNLLEDNYIQREEYPMAKKKKKPILPVEMEETDKKELCKMYDGIPKSLSEDSEAFEKVLKKIKDIALAKNESDPEHNFFIALAYLYGIDVEKNADRAVEMLAFASEKGYVEATRKLSDILQTGDGVKRDYEKAAKYQRVLAEQLKSIYEREKTEKAAEDYINALWESGDRYFSVGKLDISLEIFDEMLNWSKCSAKTFNTEYFQRLYSVSCKRLGEVYAKKGDTDAAVSYYKESLKDTKKLKDTLKTPQAKRDLSISYEKIGDIYAQNGNYDAALTFYKKLLKLSLSIADEVNTADSRRGVLISRSKIGDIHNKNGSVDLALECYSECLKSAIDILKNEPSDQAKSDLSLIYARIGYMYELSAKLDCAFDIYEKKLDLDEELAKERGTLEDARNLSVCYERLGSVYEKRSEYEKALEYYKKTLTLRNELAEKNGALQIRFELGITHYNIGGVYIKMSDHDASLNSYSKSIDLIRPLVEKAPSATFRRGLYGCYHGIGNVYEQKGMTERAIDYYKQAFDLCDALYKDCKTAEAACDLSLICESLGNIYTQKNDNSLAIVYCKRELELRKILTKSIKTAAALDDLACAYVKTAMLKHPFDTEMLIQAYSIYCSLCDACPDVMKYRKDKETMKQLLESLKG